LAFVAPHSALWLLIPGPGFSIIRLVTVTDDTIQFNLNGRMLLFAQIIV
jgi:hypothetical protein